MALARSFNSLPAKLGAAAALLGAALLAFVAVSAPAKAQNRASGWQICNETSYVLEAATGRPDGDSIQVQGWTRLRPGECRPAVAAPLARGEHYLYARTSSAHRGGQRQWGGDARLCVDSTRTFQIENPPQCGQSYEERRFRRVRINKRDSWTTSLAEATPLTRARARQMGLQRLLEDNGYDIREGRRGVDPRRIAQAIAQFRQTARLAPNANEDQLLDTLEAFARSRINQVGLRICNRTGGRVWTAVARRRGEGWESRGWWSLGADGCVRAIDEVLTQAEYYVYAALETPEGPRFLRAGGFPFCTSPARFAILNVRDCEARYYSTELFSLIRTRGRGGIVVNLDEDHFLEPGVAPRRLGPSPMEADSPAQRDGPPQRGVAPESAPTQDRTSRP